jgi:hypothetical protein
MKRGIVSVSPKGDIVAAPGADSPRFAGQSRPRRHCRK